MKPGQISDPVRSPFGYHIIYLQEKTAAKLASFDGHKMALAEELLRQSKTKERDEIYNSIIAQTKSAFEKKDFAAVSRLSRKYQLNFAQDAKANPYSGLSGQIKLEAKNKEELFKKVKAGASVITFDNLTSAKVLFAKPIKSSEQKIDLNKERDAMLKNLSSRLRQTIISKLQEKTKVKIFTKI